MKKHKLFLCLITVFLAVVSAHAQAVFQKKYGLNVESRGASSIRTLDGGYMLCGTSGAANSYGGGRILLIKTDADCNVQWSRNYGGNVAEFISTVFQNPDGTYMVLGTTYSYNSQPYGDALLMKVSSTGTLLWSKIYTGADSEYGYDLIRLSNGDYVFAGLTRTLTAGGYDFYIVRTDSAGTPVWMNKFGGIGNDEAQALVLADDGNILVMGSGYVTPDGGMMLSKVNVSTGALMWTKVYGNGPGGNGSGRDIVPALNGGYYLVGWESGANTLADIYVVKVDNSGTPLWSKAYGGTNGDYPYDACLTSDGGLAVTGYTTSFGAGGQDIFLLRLDSVGAVQWVSAFGTAGHEQSENVLAAYDGGFLLSGSTTTAFFSGVIGMYVIKTDAGGTSTCLQSSASVSVYPDSLVWASVSPFFSQPSGYSTTAFSTSLGLTDTTLCSTVGIVEVTQTEELFMLYPNPASDHVQLQLAFTGEATVTISTVEGKNCFRKTFQNESVIDIETADFTAGMYIVEVRSANAVSRQKLIIR